ncbi:MAG: hypothetical protein ABEH43_05180 [Flavobacteriales bacterium]
MKLKLLVAALSICTFLTVDKVNAQKDSTKKNEDKIANMRMGGSSRFLTKLYKNAPLSIGAYGEDHYHQPMGSDKRYNGTMDVHRLVPFLGFNFNKNVSFFTELEIEHVDEIYVEQAFIDYRINRFMTFRSGLLLMPMGIINEYHESTTFFSVERPGMDHDIIPTTWRELGAGLTGNIYSASLRYQLYAVNGFKSYDNGSGTLGGGESFRGGRQKASKSTISSPNVTGKVEYYGIKGLRVGLSGYFGKTQSTLYHGANSDMEKRADSTVVGLNMLAADFRYRIKGLKLRGQYVYGKMNNVAEYNSFTGSDLGASMSGYYVTAGYNVLNLCKKNKNQDITVFARYENYDTHNSVTGEMKENKAYDRSTITFGANYTIAKGAVLKADYQIREDGTDKDLPNMFNAGIGFWFY